MNKNLKKFIFLLIKIVVIIFIIYILFFFVFGIFRLKNNNMYPFIDEGSLVLFYRLDKNYNVGDVVVVNKNNKQEIYRIVAIGDDEVNINDDFEVLVNSYPEANETLFKTEKDVVKFPLKVKSNNYFVLNDNRSNKTDSRKFNTIKDSDIEGKVISFLKTRNI